MRDNDNATRRAVLMGVGAGGLAAALAACGGGTESTAAEQPAAPASSEPAAGGALGSTADIPVGGGKIFEAQRVVVTQPSAGEFKAFSTTCTHQGCSVDSVRDGVIVCPCHRSMFAVADGAVQGGPATRPLEEVQIKVEGDRITLA